jgi:hypothetical protein
MPEPKSESQSQPTQRCCGLCRSFSNDPAEIEATFKGLTAMSSGYASVRGQDGLCARHDVYLSFRDVCPDFEAIKQLD